VDAGELLADQLRQSGQNAKALAVLKQLQAANPTDTTVGPLIKQYEASSSPAGAAPATP
jgi:hypothetical protein